MTADHPAPRHGLTPSALQGEPILRALASGAAFETAAALAAVVGRPTKNFSRELDHLAAAGLIARPDGRPVPILTDAGARVVTTLDFAANGPATEAGPARGFQAPRAPLDTLRPNPMNPRKHFDPVALAALADTITADEDIIEPLVASPPAADGIRTIWAGERRWRACLKLADEGRLPARLAVGLPFVERDADPVTALFIAVVENSQREDLSPWEDARALADLADKTGWSARELARRVGRAPEGSESGVRDVQMKIKVAREATAEAVAEYERAGSWDRLRESVQIAQRSLLGSDPADEPPLLAALPGPATTIDDDSGDRPDLTAHERLLLVEIAHKVAHDPRADDHAGQRFAPVGKYWLDQAASTLQTARLILFRHAGAAGPQIGLTAAGADWLTAEGFTLPMSDGQLSKEQAAQGYVLASPRDVYCVGWLTPAPDADAPPDAVPDPIEDDAEALQAADVLATVNALLRDRVDGTTPDAILADLLTRTGGPAPWSPAGDDQPGVILAADGSCAAVVDVDNDLPDDLARARALLILTAVNACAASPAAEG